MLIIETRAFARRIDELLEPESYRLLQNELVVNPEKGKLIRATGGLRKLRYALEGRGKSGGIRVIYFWSAPRETCLMLLVYPKNVQDDLSDEQRKILMRLVQEEFA